MYMENVSAGVLVAWIVTSPAPPLISTYVPWSLNVALIPELAPVTIPLDTQPGLALHGEPPASDGPAGFVKFVCVPADDCVAIQIRTEVGEWNETCAS